VDLLLIAMRQMDDEIKRIRREHLKTNNREDTPEFSGFLDGFFTATKIANAVYNKGAKNTEQ